MCGIFGIVNQENIDLGKLRTLVRYSRQRGIDSSGIASFDSNGYSIHRANFDIIKLLKKVNLNNAKIALGHSRLVTNGTKDNQPVVRNKNFVVHNGIIVNESNIWELTQSKRHLEIDTEVILALTEEYFNKNKEIKGLSKYILDNVEGTVSAALGLPSIGKLLLFTNNGSLYYSKTNEADYFSSERFPLEKIGCERIVQVSTEGIIIDIPKSDSLEIHDDKSERNRDLIPKFKLDSSERDLLEFNVPNLKRCTKCVLPETMPFIHFDDKGVCNYCNNYKARNVPKPKEEILKLVEPYRRDNEAECIVPLSGGRDSMYSLHLVVKELNLKPITYTYDWGMVTDLARRNISRISSKLGVENIIIAADINKKRRNIEKNLKAWLKKPHLGMVSILTAGDKHFFRHIEKVKKQTGINLNLWGINPLEVTHFKSGFLGIKPDFLEDRVYVSKMSKQLDYQRHRFLQMFKNPSYLNSSLWDTVSGEYYRSILKKSDYYHVYDFWKWDEELIDKTLKEEYDFELAPDTKTTWRIGDGTAAFYNYIYYTVAGFTEHDTFRSNQIREGQLSRDLALKLVKDENQPRYQNIRWYLDTLGMDYIDTIKIINSIPKLY